MGARWLARATVLGIGLGVGCGARTDARTGAPLTSASAQTPAAAPDQDPPRGAKRDVLDVAVDPAGAGACAILSDGRVACWGSGPLGLAARPTPIPDLRDARSASLFEGALYVTHTNGDTTLHTRGALGSEHLIAGGRRVFLAGDSMTCSVGTDANVTCFDRRSPGDPLADWNATVSLAVGKAHACMLQRDDGVRCLGANESGQLGIAPGAAMPPSGLVTAQRFAAIGVSAGDAHSCAVSKEGDAYCWGAPPEALGRDAASGPKVAGVSGAVAIASGGAHTCVLDADGAAMCWGKDASEDRRGTRPPTKAHPPSRVPGQARFVKLAVGEQTCAVTAGMRLFCWGKVAAYEPVRVAGLEDARELVVAGDRSCAETPKGAVCWGDAAARRYGSCAIDAAGSVGCRRAEASAAMSPGVEDATGLAVGTFHACALRRAGAVACWGDNSFGQLGRTPCGMGALSPELREILGDSATPCAVSEERAIDVEGVSDAIVIAAEGMTTCALLRSGEVKCWGSGPALGPRDLTDARPAWAPVTIEGVKGAVQISVGGRHACARNGAGAVTCWGADGHKPYNPRTGAVDPAPLAPVRVPIADAIDIASGDRVTCAVRQTGVVSCWGDLDDVTRGGPEDMYGTWIFDVRNLRNAVNVGVGDRHACALTSSGSGYCWGSGDLGQLGDGSGGDTPREVEIVVE